MMSDNGVKLYNNITDIIEELNQEGKPKAYILGYIESYIKSELDIYEDLWTTKEIIDILIEIVLYNFI